MSIKVKAFQGLWKLIGKGDSARLAKKDFPTDVIQYTDIPYIDDGTWEHKLDVYVPEGTKPNARLPVIIDVHGGGWYYGDKELNKFFCLHLCREGFVVFNMSYRLAPQHNIKDMMEDVMSALNYIGNHLKDYPCDKNRVFITGDSAGGQLASHATAITINKDMRKAYGVKKPKLKIKAVGLTSPCPYAKPKGLMKFYLKEIVGKKYKKENYGKYLDFKKVIKTCDDKFPPTIIFTSLFDVIAEFQAKDAYKLLKKNGTKAKFDKRFNPALQHVYMVTDPDLPGGQRAIKMMTEFFKNQK